MDPSDNAGGVAILGQLFRDANVSRYELEDLFRTFDLCRAAQGDDGSREWSAIVAAHGVEQIYEAIAQGDFARADQILRSWGVRRCH